MITLDGTTGITTPDIDSTAGFDGEDLTGDVAAARITGALNATGSAPLYACRAWVNFNGTGAVAINGSGNVSSITDNGTGNYTVNFATAVPDANYVASISGARGTSNDDFRCGIKFGGTYSTSAVQIFTGVASSGGTYVDGNPVNVSIFR